MEMRQKQNPYAEHFIPFLWLFSGRPFSFSKHSTYLIWLTQIVLKWNNNQKYALLIIKEYTMTGNKEIQEIETL